MWRSNGCAHVIKINRAGEMKAYESHAANCYFKTVVEPQAGLKKRGLEK